ncbi:MAG: EAL domain-containing protein [Gammaproteobacteria bacterium]|nr:EAL domain-containing protein [Gammaproteobacteria bacterium]
MTEQNLHIKKENSDDVAKKFAVLRENYKQKLPTKISNIEQLWEKLRYFNWSDEAFHILHNLVHALTGSGKTFGFSAVSECARELETYLNDLLVSHLTPDENQQKKIAQLIESLHRAVENPDMNAPAITDLPTLKPEEKILRNLQLIYIVDDDVHTAEYLTTYLTNIGYKVNTFHQIKDVYEALKENSPAAVIMDIMFPEGSLAGIDSVDKIRATTGVHTPILFISARTDVTARLGVVRAGGGAYFTKPINIESLINKLDEVALPNISEGHRVLLIEDDVDLAERYKIVLQHAGITTQIVTQPMKTIQAIHDFIPDVLLMDMNMPEVNGLELASVIRQEQQLVGLPIVFVTAESHPEIRGRAMKIGGDEFITKPVSDKALVEVVHRSIKKSKRLFNTIKQISRHNLQTGMINRKSFLADLEQAVATIKEKNETKALIYITIDHFDVIIKQVGLTGLDPLASELAQRIQASIDINDQASQMAEGIFAILSVTSDENSLKQLTETIHKNITTSPISIDKHKLKVECSIGVSYITNATFNIQNIFEQAEEAAAKAREQNENKIKIYNDPKQIVSSDKTAAELRNKIIRAIKEKSFRLVFQPILNVANEKQEHYEVLLRMIDEDNKVVLPAQFFPVAEEENLIHEIDRWAIEHAIKMLSDNVRIRTRGTFFIKVAGESIVRDSFLTWICNCISNSRLRGEQKVVFELSEKDITNRVEQVKSFSHSLQNLSCGFAIEHFGSTNQHQSLINEISVNFVKIAMPKTSQFLTDSSENSKLQKLIKEMQSKNINIIASMVDDPRIITLLWEWGVNYFQGYFIEEPHETLDFDFSQAELFKK